MGILAVGVYSLTGALWRPGRRYSPRSPTSPPSSRRSTIRATLTDSDFSAVMTIITQDPEKGAEKFVVRQFRRDRENKFLLLIQEPKAQMGQGYLMDEENLWFYDPESRKFSHTSLKESFAGSDARNEDFTQSSLAKDYRATAYETGVLGNFDVYIIDLEAVHNEVADPYLRIWVSQGDNLVLKMESYSLTKRLMRTGALPQLRQGRQTPSSPG